MITLEIRYWNSKPSTLDWIGDECFEYSTSSEYKKSLKKIMARIDESNCNAMLLNNAVSYSNTKILFIDKGRFRNG